MNLGSQFVQRVLRLDDPLTRDVRVDRGLRVPMPDGTTGWRRWNGSPSSPGSATRSCSSAPSYMGFVQ